MRRAQNTIHAAIAAAKNNRQHTDCYALMPVAAEEVKEAATHDLHIAGYTHVIDGSAIRHTFKNHGNPQKESARWQIAITDADFERIAQILATPERVIYGLQNNRGAEVIGHIKAMPDGTLAYLESVRTKKSTLAMQTMWKYPRGTSAASIEKALRLTSGTARGSGQTVKEALINSRGKNNSQVKQLVVFPSSGTTRINQRFLNDTPAPRNFAAQATARV